jgi:hypothetical protein
MDQKRTEWSGDAAAQARRDSFNDQKPQAGIFGTMWNKYALPDQRSRRDVGLTELQFHNWGKKVEKCTR